MKSKTPLLLLLALLAIVAIIAFRHLSEDEPTETRPENPPVLAGEPGPASRLAIIPAEGPEMVFVKRDGNWQIVQPLETAALNYRVADAADLLSNLRAERQFAPGEKETPTLDDMGLSRPRWTLALTDQTGQRFELEVGTAPPLDPQATYVRRPGESTVSVVRRDFATALGRSAKDYRQKTVLDLPQADIRALSITGRGRPIRLEEREGAWQLTEPQAGRADPNAIADLLREISYLRAEAFVDSAPASLARYGLSAEGNPLVIQATLAGPASETAPATAPAAKVRELWLGLPTRDRKSVYARTGDSNSVFLLPADLIETFSPDPLSLRDKRLLAFSPAAVTRVRLRSGGRPFTFVRTAGGFEAVEPYAGPADANAVSDLLAELAAAEAEDWTLAAPVPQAVWTEDPAARVELHTADANRPVVLLRGPATGTGRLTYVKAGGSPLTATIRTERAEQLFPAPDTLWGTRLYTRPAETAVARVTVAKPGETWLLTRDANGLWQAQAPVKVRADQDQVNRLIETLSNLRAEQVVAVGPVVPNTYAKDDNRIIVALEGPAAAAQTRPASGPATRPTTQPTTQPATQPAGRLAKSFSAVRLDGKTYAWVEGRTITAVGQFPESLYETFNAELRDRRVWQFDPNAVRAFRVIGGPDRLALQRTETGWAFANDPALEVDDERVNRYLADLADLRLERFYVHTGQGREEPKKYGFDELMMSIEVDLAGSDRPLVLDVGMGGLNRAENRFARASTVGGVFLLDATTLRKITATVEMFEKQTP